MSEIHPDKRTYPNSNAIGAGRFQTEGSSASHGIQPGRSSSHGVTRLIQGYREKERLTFQQDALNGTIELVPQLKISYGKVYAEFKIGAKKKYVLKNTQVFANSLRRREFVSYGKELEFYHTLEAFEVTSRPLAEFLLREAQMRETTRSGWEYYGNKGRYVEINSGNADDFFAAVAEREFLVDMEFGSKKKWRICLENYRPQLIIRGQEDGAAVQTGSFFYIHGRAYTYQWRDGVVFQQPLEETREIIPFWEHLNNFKYEEFFVGKSELSAFCQELLPVLERHYRVEKQEFEEGTFLPPKPEFELYLDAPDRQSVTCALLAVYGEKKYNVYEKPKILDNRDELEELKTRQKVLSWFGNVDPQKKQMVIVGDEDKLYELLAEGMAALSGVGAVYVSDELKSMEIRQSPAISVGVSLKEDLLELTLESPEMPLSELVEILSAYQRKRKFFRLKNGDFLSMEEEGLAVLSQIQEGVGISAADWQSGNIRLPKYRALYLDGELRERHGFHARKNKDFRALIRNMKTVEDNDFEVPPSLERVLREYQKQGFLWLKTLKNNGFGGILADDMGLGKTLQIIAFLLSEQEERTGAPYFALIVCPASLVYNWKSEIERFAPTLSVIMVTGTAEERKERIRRAGTEDILITSYDLLRRDSSYYRERHFGIQVIDEAQYIKNHTTKAAKAVKEIRADFKVALTGTPIENRLSELWSIFDYLMPGFLFPYRRFREEFEVPIVAGNQEEEMDCLRRMIRPFVLRRLKRDVLKELPAKLEEAVYAGMEGEQMRLYCAHAQRLRLMLEGQTEEEFATQKIQMLSELTRLRQLCCDPALVYEDYHEESAKLVMCMELIQNAIEGGHKILLFSQYTTMLSRIQQQMQNANIPFLSLTGATKKERRVELVEEFQTGKVPVFCISLKAGGTGLNLTAADIVIHYDPWWNVAVQNQATDRAHRIGQKNPVTVYKLIAKGTIEENILRLQEKKSRLAGQLLGEEGFESVKFTREEILELLTMPR